MIYLIGGPPRCGKTSLAKALSKQLGIPWISSDTLEVVAGEYMTQEEWEQTHPYSIAHTSNNAFYKEFSTKEIIDLIKAQALATQPAIEMTVLCALKDQLDYVVEGYHVTPKFATKLIKRFGKANIKAVFLVQTDVDRFVTDAPQNSVLNDWLNKKDTTPDTLVRVAKMVVTYSASLIKDATKYKLPVFVMDKNWHKSIINISKSLKQSK